MNILSHCYFCSKKIQPREIIIELRFGLSHENCYLKNRLDYYKNELKRISDLPKLENNFIIAYNSYIKLAKNLEQKHFNRNQTDKLYEEWLIVNRNMMDIEVLWGVVNFYFAQRSWSKKLSAWLLERPFAYPGTNKLVNNWHKNWQELLSVFTDYFNLSIEPSFINEISTLSGFETKGECLKRIETLIQETGDLVENIFSKVRRDIRRYSTELSKEYHMWREANRPKLIKYKLYH